MMHAAILFEPDGYLLDRSRPMGRQSAGTGFLRAAVAACQGGALSAYTPARQSFDSFARTVAALDPAVQADWIPANRLDLLAQAGTLYRPDNAIDVPAATRLRAGLLAYSLCGITHTLSTEAALRHVSNLMTSPVMPWDAIICTSNAALTVMREALAANADYLAWRFGQPMRVPDVQLPVIPLGVHTRDFAMQAGDRIAARRRLDLADDEVAALFAGRLSFSGKAHPVSMLRGLQAAHERTGRRVVLIQAGHFANDQMAPLYRDAAAKFAPDIRMLFVDGRDFDAYAATWRAADLFLSLADNIQETFGLTPVEAMAAGLPVIVSDWNGYKDTVRDGIDGFRIRTWAPAQEVGDAIARDYETRMSNLDLFLVRTSGAVAVDQAQLNDRLSELVDNADLRSRLGAAGRARAAAEFDWAIVYTRYQELWTELAATRRSCTADPDWSRRVAAAPHRHPAFPDPYTLFAHYPTSNVTAEIEVHPTADATMDRFEAIGSDPLFRLACAAPDVAAVILRAIGHASSVREIASACGLPEGNVADAVTRLAKMGLVRLVARDGADNEGSGLLDRA